MDNMLKFLEFASIDPHMYWRIPSKDESTTFEVQWRREAKLRWRFRPHDDVLWNLGDDENLISQFANSGMDTEIFEKQLKHSLLHQVCFADRIVADARQLLGEAEVDTALAEHQEFISSIEEAVGDLIAEKTANAPVKRVGGKTPTLKLIKD